MTAQQIAGGFRNTIRSSARLIGLFSIGLYFLFIIESGARIVPALSWSNFRGMPLFLALTMAVVGLVIAWRREALGGFLALVGGASILTLVYLASGAGMTFTAALLAWPLLASGLLYLIGSVWTRLAAQPAAYTLQAVKCNRRLRTSTAQCRLETQKRQAHA